MEESINYGEITSLLLYNTINILLFMIVYKYKQEVNEEVDDSRYNNEEESVSWSHYEHLDEVLSHELINFSNYRY